MAQLLEIESPTPGSAQEIRTPLSVLHVVLSLEVGGLERVVLDLVRQGGRLGQKVSVLCLERAGALAEDARTFKARIVCVDKPPGFRPGLIRRIAATLGELQPNVVHCHQVGALFYAAPAAHRAGVPVVVHTEHGKHYAARMRTRWLGRLAGRNVDRFFCVSSDIADEVRRCRIIHPRKIAVLPNGIDVRRFERPADAAIRAGLGIASDAPVIGTVARLSEVKRQDLLLHAFAKVRQALPAAHLLIVGDGPLRHDLEQLADNLGIAPFVHFAGYQPEPEKFLAVMDVFTLTSRSEGMPLSVLEAWAAALPVVASAVGGIPQMIGGSEAGLLFLPGDANALTSILIDLLVDEPARRKMGQRGRAIVRDLYGAERMADEYHRNYRLLLSGNAVQALQ
jgi:glycosyltransferase involved in cell wall biosynthesis